MDTSLNSRGQTWELPVTLAVFLTLLMYTYGILIAVPYSGFYINPTTGRIEAVFTENPSLKIGDVVKRISNLTLEEYKANRNLVFFEGLDLNKGEIVEIVVERNENTLVIPWAFPGFNFREFANRLFNSWILAYAFGLAGLVAQTSIRPRDTRRTLFISLNYLTALFLVFGTLSFSHLWASSTLLHTFSWLLAPVFLHFHWVFPRPLGNLSNTVWKFLYSIAGLLSLGEVFQLLDRQLYTLGFIIALLGSTILLLIHFIRQKEERSIVFWLIVSILFAFSFSIISAIALAFNSIINFGWVTAFSMPFMPLTYFYLIYRRQLGGMETRINRLISNYAFLIFIGIFFFTALIYFMQTPLSQENWAALSFVSIIFTSIITAYFLPRFRAFADRRFFGIKLPYQHLPETYSSRITTSDTLPSLLALLESEVFPSLLIRQYAFLHSNENKLSVILAKDIPDNSFDFETLAEQTGHYIPNLPPNEGWMRLILPLNVGDKTLGFWLLGKRDPDDLYPQVEIPILQSLADQTAIALSNILQSEQLRNFYQADIENIESERNRIARDLHDIVLNQLATMRNSLDQKTLPQAFLSAYDDLKRQLREIVTNLRPPMLDQGLGYALQEFVEVLQEKNPNVDIALNIDPSDGRIPDKMEEHLFQIVREACENTLRHAKARTLTISGKIASEQVELSIRDDGKGFNANSEINALLANRHFGLVNMKERALIVFADMDIQSQTGQGTSIHIAWQSKS